MPTLTELLEGKAAHAERETCSRCQKRKATVYVQGRALVRHSADPEKEAGRNSARGTNSLIASTRGVVLCRTCAHEVIGQIAQLLGTEVRDGEAD